MDYVKKDKTVVTDEWMDSIAKAAEAGSLPGTVIKTETGPSRLKTFENDELESITFRIRKSRLSMIDNVATQTGRSRSDFLREAVDEKLERIS
jgi:hypothetical protein